MKLTVVCQLILFHIRIFTKTNEVVAAIVVNRDRKRIFYIIIFVSYPRSLRPPRPLAVSIGPLSFKAPKNALQSFPFWNTTATQPGWLARALSGLAANRFLCS